MTPNRRASPTDRLESRPRSVKVDDQLWVAAQNAAAALDTDVSKEVRAALRALVKRAARTAPARPDATTGGTPTTTEEPQP